MESLLAVASRRRLLAVGLVLFLLLALAVPRSAVGCDPFPPPEPFCAKSLVLAHAAPEFVLPPDLAAVRDDLPMSSGLLLRPGGRDDGLLQAHEVLDMDLRADLVTLSACRTGRGSLQRGEGIVGLSRAFLHAGASSVLVSLRDVDDRSTPILMEAFYRGVARGLDRASALRDARRELFTQRGTAQLVFSQRPLAYAHPRYWASFVLVGTP